MHNGAESVGSSNTLVYSRGFTIVELLVVIVVIGILAAITIVSYTGITNKATIASIQSDLTNASNIFKMDQVVNGKYPATLADANSSKGITSCAGTTTCFYAVNNSLTPQGFCMAVTKNLTAYRITNDSAPTVGDCQNYGQLVSLDAGNTSSYSGSGTAWTDLSGNGNHGTLVNGTGYINPGIYPNDANLVFDGTNDGVSLPAITPNKEVTFNAFIYLNGANTNYGTIFSNYGAGGNAYYIGTYLNLPSSIQVYFNTSLVATITSLPMNTWMMLTVTHNGTTAIGYINAVQQFSAASTLISSTNVTGVGYDVARSNYPFKGSIATAQIYNRALPAAEILQNFNALKGRYGL